ncbi:GNAT family N-acetyltransferase [Aquimarina addita]|uniref:GNAT family N-acetyltransferase n=1 Tax=Aquimarina addita TaxID=870485 RepID=A0ABP7XEW4_9FLAO
MKYQISKATSGDLPLMQRLFYQTVTMYGAKLFTKDEVKMYSKLAINTKYWEQKFLYDLVYNAKLNGEVIGSFSLTKEGFIEYIFVHQNYQGKGIANSLYKALENAAKESGLVRLTTRVNSSTGTFFKKNGFEVVKEIKKVAGGEEVVHIVGTKEI